MVVLIDPTGTVTLLYTELVPLTALGPQTLVRASHIEPEADGQWFAAIVDGPRLGPFPRRSDALAAEVAWLTEQRLSVPQSSSPR